MICGAETIVVRLLNQVNIVAYVLGITASILPADTVKMFLVGDKRRAVRQHGEEGNH